MGASNIFRRDSPSHYSEKKEVVKVQNQLIVLRGHSLPTLQVAHRFYLYRIMDELCNKIHKK